MELRYSAKTDVGLSREHNEDNFLVDPPLNLFMVADGMGGHNAGEVASAMAVNLTRDALQQGMKILRSYRENPKNVGARSRVRELLETSVKDSCYKIFEQGLNNSAQRGMGTTLTFAVILGTRAFIAHVGDSRVYLRRDGTAHQITQDHSMVNELIKHGKITNLKDLDHRFKNAVTRAVGVHESVEVDVMDFDLLPGDRLLICSDGLHGYMDEASVNRELSVDDLDDIASNLVQLANRKGGKDNITHVIIEAAGAPEDYSELYLKAATVKNLDVFRFLNFEELMRVMHLTYELPVRDGQVLFEQGADDARFMIIVDGEVKLTDESGEESLVGPGSHFGEMSLVGSAPRTSRAVASKPGTILVMERAPFFELMRREPSLAMKCMWSFVTTLSERLGKTSEALSKVRAGKDGDVNWTDQALWGVTSPDVMPRDMLPEGLREMTKATASAPPPPPPPLPPGLGGKS